MQSIIENLKRRLFHSNLIFQLKGPDTIEGDTTTPIRQGERRWLYINYPNQRILIENVGGIRPIKIDLTTNNLKTSSVEPYQARLLGSGVLKASKTHTIGWIEQNGLRFYEMWTQASRRFRKADLHTPQNGATLTIKRG
jgi:hypothetical protein